MRKLKFTLLLLAVTSMFGCSINSTYKIKSALEPYPQAILQKENIAVIHFDAATPSAAINAAGAFGGGLGVLIADATTRDQPETIALGLQENTTTLIEEKFAEANIDNFIRLISNIEE